MKKNPKLLEATYGALFLAVVFWVASIIDLAWWLSLGCLVLAALFAWGAMVGFPETKSKEKDA